MLCDTCGCCGNRSDNTTNSTADENTRTLIQVDNITLYNTPERFYRRWTERCRRGCINACCYFGISGHRIDYASEIKDIKPAQRFWTYDFVIMRFSTPEIIESSGFRREANEEYLDDLKVCPLALPDRGCLIYEDRPLICREFACNMMLGKQMQIE